MFLPKLSCSIMHFSRAPSAANSFYIFCFRYVEILICDVRVQAKHFQSSPFLLRFGIRLALHFVLLRRLFVFLRILVAKVVVALPKLLIDV